MQDKIAEFRARHSQLEQQIADPDLHKDHDRAIAVMKEHARLSDIVAVADEVDDLTRRIGDNRDLFESETDEEMRRRVPELEEAH